VSYRMIDHLAKACGRVRGAALTHRGVICGDIAQRYSDRMAPDQQYPDIHELFTWIGDDLEQYHQEVVEAETRLMHHLTDELRESVEQARAACVAEPAGDVLSPIERADREEEIADWLARHHCDQAHAGRLAETAVRMEVLDTLAKVMSGDQLDTVLRWMAVGCETHSLATDIEHAATRIHELVAAVKRFTQMDNPAAPDSVDVETGLRDTIRVVASKAKAKGADITLDVEPHLPRVCATEGELNQVWLNLIDNALDAIPQSGSIDISARRELDSVVVRVVDDGPGIPPDIEPRVFDPFFTTKAPGQGLGLGLEITRRLVRRYYGDIAVGSRPGRTEFRVSLAMEQPVAATEPGESK